MTNTGAQVDKALVSLGSRNAWRITIVTLLSLTFWCSSCYNQMSTSFIAENTPHFCANQTKRYPTKDVNGKEEKSKCKKYEDSSSNKTVPCGEEGWTYVIEKGASTTVSEWDLVCDRSFMRDLSLTCMYLGAMVSSLIGTRLADRFGRKWMHIIAELCLLVVSVTIAFSPNIQVFTAMRFFAGFFFELATAAGFVLVCELFPTSQRPFAGTFSQICWVVAWCILALMAYFIRNWRHLQLALNIPFILVISYIWLLPESVPWLIANSREKQAVEILKRLAGKNANLDEINCLLDDEEIPSKNKTEDEDDVESNKVTPVELEKNPPMRTMSMAPKANRKKSIVELGRTVRSKSLFIPNEDSEEEDLSVEFMRKRLRTMSVSAQGKHAYVWWMMFKNKVLVINMIITAFTWFTSQVVYLSVSLLSTSLAGDKYINFLLIGLVELPAYVADAFILTKFGRRIPLSISLFVSGVAAAIYPFIPAKVSGVDLTPLTVTVVLFCKMCITFSFGAIYVYVTELYPTNFRNAGLGIASCFGKVGGMCVPIVLFMNDVKTWLPGIICGALAFLAGGLILLLPETHHQPLAVTIEDIEKMSRFGPKKRKLPND